MKRVSSGLDGGGVIAERDRRGFHIAVKALAVLLGVLAVGVLGLRLAGQRSLQRAIERAAAADRVLLLPADSEAKVPDPAAGTAVRAALAALEWTPEEATAIGTMAFRPEPGLTDEERALVDGVLERNRAVLARLTVSLSADLDGRLYEPPEMPQGRVEPGELRERVEASNAEIQAYGQQATRASRLLAAAARVELGRGNVSVAAGHLSTLSRLAEAHESGADALSFGLGLHAEHLALRGGLEVVAAPSAADEGVLQVLEKLPVGVPLEVMVHHVIASWRESLGRMLNPPPSPSDDERTLVQRVLGVVVWPALRAFSMAAAVDLQTDLIELLGTPYGVEPARFEHPPRPPRWRLDRGLALVGMPNLRELIRRGQLVEAERQLLDAAVALRRLGLGLGSYPADRPSLPALDTPDPYSGRLLEYETLPDGRLRLAVAGGEELTADMRGAYRGALRPVVLPPLQ